MNFLNEVVEFMKDLQDNICNHLEELDGHSTFMQDLWEREQGGGGRTRVINDGLLIEKGGVNFSHVHGELPSFLKDKYPAGEKFDATGVSIVLHPQNPFVPIIHMNVRYFQLDTGEYWFGGGIDVSPAYPNIEDTKAIHEHLKKVCDNSNETFYPTYKAWCDTYFTIVHRQEMRGVGGIFFDHIHAENTFLNREQLLGFIKDVGNAFNPIYAFLVKNNRDKPYFESNKNWQYIRRGRYAEFNLVYDRGTHFGLQTNGRVESILMSLPPMASWVYNFIPEPDSEEAHTLPFFQPQDWV